MGAHRSRWWKKWVKLKNSSLIKQMTRFISRIWHRKILSLETRFLTNSSIEFPKTTAIWKVHQVVTLVIINLTNKIKMRKTLKVRSQAEDIIFSLKKFWIRTMTKRIDINSKIWARNRILNSFREEKPFKGYMTQYISPKSAFCL